MKPILYYVHHQGQGHWQRALAVADQLGRPVVFASSTPPPRRLPRACVYESLPLDYSPVREAQGQDANGLLHWAPRHETGLLARHRVLLDAAARHQPALAVVDVSVEVTVLLRTSGIPVVAVRQPGSREDPAHTLGFGLADEVVMPVPAAWGLHLGLPRTRAVGLVTAPRTASPASGGRPAARPQAVVLVGSGGSRLDAVSCARIAAELPGHDVQVLGISGQSAGNLCFHGRVKDPWPLLCGADVIIGNTGLGTVGDVVTAQKPFVALPEERPFGEQRATAEALRASGAAVVLTQMPGPGEWAQAVRQATTPPALIADGAARFARLLEARTSAVPTQTTHPSPEPMEVA